MKTSKVVVIVLACAIAIPPTPVRALLKTNGAPQAAFVPFIVWALAAGAALIFNSCDIVIPPPDGLKTMFESVPVKKTYDTAAYFKYDTNPPGLAKSFECSLDNSSEDTFQPCPPPFTISNLSVGTHTFYVRAIESDGTEGVINSYQWAIFRPDQPIAWIVPPYPSGISRRATLSFKVDDQYLAPVTFECSLDGRSYEACSSPWSYFNLADGKHQFKVRAIQVGGSGNIGPEDSYTWAVSIDSLQTMGAYVLLNVGTASNNQSKLYYLKRGSSDTSYTLLADVIPGLGSGASDMEIDDLEDQAFVAVRGPTKRVIAIDLSKLKEANASPPNLSFADLCVFTTPYDKQLLAADGLSNTVYRMNLPSLAVTDSLRMGTASNRPFGVTAAGNKVFACMFDNGLGDALQIMNWQNRSSASRKLKPGIKFAATSGDGNTVWTVCTGNAYTTPPTTGWVYTINASTHATIDSLAHNKQILTAALGRDGSMFIVESSGAASQGSVHRLRMNAGKIGITTNILSEPYQSVAADDRNIFAARADAAGNVVLDVYPLGGGTYLKRFSFSVAPGPVNFLMVKVR